MAPKRIKLKKELYVSKKLLKDHRDPPGSEARRQLRPGHAAGHLAGLRAPRRPRTRLQRADQL